ncbi:MAG TPA: hypothetical protein VIV40_01310 [Kofleriaceae bacterium]
MSKYDLFRRRIAPIAFGLAIAFMAYSTCNKQQRTAATFVIDYGAAERDVHAIDAEVWMNGEQVTQFHRVALEGAYIGATRFKASLPDVDGELRMDVELTSGEHRNITRVIHVSEGATVTVQLERDLR